MEVFELLFLLSLFQLVLCCIPTTSPESAWSPEENASRSSKKFKSQEENRRPRRNITNIDKNPGTNRNNSDEEGSGSDGGNENDDNGNPFELPMDFIDTGGQCINPYKNDCLTGTVRMTCASSTEAQVDELRVQIDMMWVRTLTFICPLGTSPYALTVGNMTPMQIPPVPLICSDTILDGEEEKQYKLPAGDNVMELSCMSVY
ncbi:unnamed protein product [Auanema sp. JU1783]|nr:unnamed protein product [Auanema sp. JU1783]